MWWVILFCRQTVLAHRRTLSCALPGTHIPWRGTEWGHWENSSPAYHRQRRYVKERNRRRTTEIGWTWRNCITGAASCGRQTFSNVLLLSEHGKSSAGRVRHPTQKSWKNKAFEWAYSLLPSWPYTPKLHNANHALKTGFWAIFLTCLFYHIICGFTTPK